MCQSLRCDRHEQRSVDSPGVRVEELLHAVAADTGEERLLGVAESGGWRRAHQQVLMEWSIDVADRELPGDRTQRQQGDASGACSARERPTRGW